MIDELMMLKDLVHRTTKDNRPYILCTLGDKTGQVAGVFWDIPDRLSQVIHAGQVLFVTGKVTKYKDSLQVSMTDLYPHEKPDLADFLPSSARSASEMIEELKGIVSSLAEPYRALLTRLLLEDRFVKEFANAPAAKSMHHASVGGLLDHTLSMCRIASFLAAHYPHVNKDLLLSGTLLHDFGKVWEYQLQGEFVLSDDGQMVGHITRAAIEVEKAAAELEDVSQETVREILHLILSHHGTHQWGSPILPKTLEAILLHQIDLLDSRIQGFFDYLDTDASEDGWTAKRSPMHDTFLLHPKNRKE